jgi:hypothetical protein
MQDVVLCGRSLAWLPQQQQQQQQPSIADHLFYGASCQSVAAIAKG